MKPPTLMSRSHYREFSSPHFHGNNSAYQASPLTQPRHVVLLSYIQMCYEWDEGKNRLNQEKHGISFEIAALVFTFTGRKPMAKKSPALSRPARLKRMTSDDIKNRKWSEKERQTLRRHAAKQAAGDDSDINFEDIPHLTDQQLSRMVRLRDIRPKVPVSVRLEPRVLDWLKSKGEGHLTRINDILKNIMEAEQRIAHR